MFIANRKSKIISIRISPEEYESLKNMYAASGRRSVSALAREAMQRIIYDANNGDAGSADVDKRLRDLDARLNLLQRDVSRLSHIVSRGFVAGKKESAGQ